MEKGNLLSGILLLIHDGDNGKISLDLKIG